MLPETQATTASSLPEEPVTATASPRQPAVLSSVFRSIFLDTPRDLFRSIFGFFIRYIRHFTDSLRYFFRPSLVRASFPDKDFREDCQRTFELVLLVMAFLTFLIKMDWIPTDAELNEIYSNDIFSKVMEAYMFLIFGAAYALMVLLTVMVGRVLRFFFRPAFSRPDTDIHFTYLNNGLFSISALVAFFFRTGVKFEQVTDDEVFANNVIAIYALIFAPLILIWSVRFARVAGMRLWSRIFFIPIASVFFIVFFALAASMLTFLMLGA